MDLFTSWSITCVHYYCKSVTVSCKEWMQSALSPSLQKNIVGRGRPLLYVYTCADFVHVKSVANLSSGCYKNINISQIKKKRWTSFNIGVCPFRRLSRLYHLWIDYFYTVQKRYVTFISQRGCSIPKCLRITSFPLKWSAWRTPVHLCTSLLHRIKSSFGRVDQAGRLSRNASNARKSDAYIASAIIPYSLRE